jgi:serine/threonine protein kinase
LLTPGSSTPEDKLIGRTLGQYRILELIGRGGMGAVYKCRQPALDRFVAVKVLPKAFSKDRGFVERFHREARSAAAVRHPNVIEVYDVGEDHGRQFIAMEFIDGEALSAALRRGEKLDPLRGFHILRQMTAALEAAHETGILHRDIKPGNILIDRRGLAKMADFGLAKRSGADMSVTAPGSRIGTPFYYPPEVVRGREADPRSDLYSLGATFFHLLAGRPPFLGTTAAELGVKHVEATVPPLHKYAPNAPEPLCHVVHKLLRKKPRGRYQNASELLRALDRAEPRLSRLPSDATQPTPPTPYRPIAGRVAPKTPHGPAAEPHAVRPRHKPMAERLEEKARNRRHVAVGVAATLVALVALWVFFGPGSGRRQAAKPRVPTRKARVEEAKKPRPQPAPVVKPLEKKDAPKKKWEPKPKLAPWQVAWNEADGKAEALVAEQRYADAVAAYDALLETFDDLALRKRVSDATEVVHAQARAAWRKLEGEAKRLAGQGEFDAARARLKPVLERFGMIELTAHARGLLQKMDVAEKAAKEAAAKAVEEAAKQAEAERRQQAMARRCLAEERLATVLVSAEAMARAWDFRGAAAALTALKKDATKEPLPRDLAERLAMRLNGITRLTALKARMIADINAAAPRLRKSHLLLPGINGEIAEADGKAIATSLPGGQTESIRWGSLNARSVNMLVQRVVVRESADDWLAAGILSAVVGDLTAAERHFSQARELGADTTRHLDLLAEALFLRARALLAASEFAKARAALTSLRTACGGAPWFAAHKEAINAAAARAEGGITIRAAEKLYARAAELYAERDLWAVRPIVERIKVGCPEAPLLTDPTRKPTFAEMAEAVAKLGRILIVRQDGEGDFKTIRAALDAATPYSLIEIQDSAVYSETFVIPKEKEGLILRGDKGCFPIVTSRGADTRPNVLVHVVAPRAAMSRLVIVHGAPGPKDPITLRVSATDFRLRSAVLSIPMKEGRPLSFRNDGGATAVLEQCIFVGSASNGNELAVRDSIWLRDAFHQVLGSLKLHNVVLPHLAPHTDNHRVMAPCEAYSCTIPGAVNFGVGSNVIADSIVRVVFSEKASTRIDHCDVTDKEPFRGLAKAGKRCFGEDPLFRDATNFDYRLRRASPCRRRASDGGDVGCRYTPEMLEMLKMAFELRKKGLIKF